MRPRFHCEFEYIRSPHLAQIYEGFHRLEQKGIVALSVTPPSSQKNAPLLTVIVKIDDSSKEYRVCYDTLDGLNWLSSDSVQENLSFFSKIKDLDFYFKRSYCDLVSENAPVGCRVHPLGLNYHMESKHGFDPSLKLRLKRAIKSLLPKRYHAGLISPEDFEYPPIFNSETKLLFLTRLWDVDAVPGERLKVERERINRDRIESIKACRKEFGDLFTGGLQRTPYAERVAPELIAPRGLTNKTAYIQNIRNHNICIATTGLHDSIGWKFSEYVANSRAVITEPLAYQAPGGFSRNTNYLEFSNKDEMLEKALRLFEDRETMQEMMVNNFHYYNNWLKPDILVLNTLFAILSAH